jgi:thymidylate synthase ThyX
MDSDTQLSKPAVNTSAVCQEIYAKVSALRDKPEQEIREAIEKDYKHLDASIYSTPLEVAIATLKDM